MRAIVSGIASGVLSGAILIVFLFWLDAGVLISVGAGLLTYIGLQLLFPRTVKRMVFVAEGVTAEELRRVLEEGREKIPVIELAGKKIEKTKVREQVLDICSLSAKILDDLERDPRSIKSARKFLNYYLDTTSYIVNRYAELCTEAKYSEQVALTLKKVEDTLTLIEQTFVKQMERLLQDDVDDLDIELELLQKTIKTEGI